MKKKSLIIFAAINLLLLFAAIFCMVKTCKNNERINNISAEFRYAETDGKVTLDERKDGNDEIRQERRLRVRLLFVR